MIFCMLVQNQLKVVSSIFRCGQKWPWSFSLWDTKTRCILRMNLWLNWYPALWHLYAGSPLQSCFLIKKVPSTGVSLWTLRNLLKNTFFTKHLQNATSEYFAGSMFAFFLSKDANAHDYFKIWVFESSYFAKHTCFCNSQNLTISW